MEGMKSLVYSPGSTNTWMDLDRVSIFMIGSSNLGDSTLHGLFYMSKAKSKKSLAFWFMITCLALSYAILQTVEEIRRIAVSAPFRIENRVATEAEIQAANPIRIQVLYINSLDTLNWTLIQESAHQLNVDSTLAAHLLELFEFNTSILNAHTDNDIEQVLTKNRIILTQQVSLWTVKQFLIAIRRAIVNAVYCTKNQEENVARREILANGMIAFTCTFSGMTKEFIYVRKGEEFWALPNNAINFTKTIASFTIIRMVDSFNRYSSDELLNRSAVYFTVANFLSNYATYNTINCTHKENGRIRYSMQRGIDCFMWIYETKTDLTFYHDQDSGTCARIFNNHGNSCLEVFVVGVGVQDYASVRIYTPTFSLYTLIANIDETLGVWTGASMLSFVHLISICCCKICSRKTTFVEQA